MAQIYVFGRVMHELTPKESQSKQPYVCFDLMERSGGEHPNFYQVWARGDQVARLTRLKVKKGSMIWLTGSQKLVDVRQKDGATSQPSIQDSANTNTDSRNTSSTPPITAAVGAGVATQ